MFLVLQICVADVKQSISRYLFLDTTESSNSTTKCVCNIYIQNTAERLTFDLTFQVGGNYKIINITEVSETHGNSLDGIHILSTICHPSKRCEVKCSPGIIYEESSTCLLIYTKGII